MRCFLSHNAADKELARSVGAHMTLSGVEVWFDEREIQAAPHRVFSVDERSTYSGLLNRCTGVSVIAATLVSHGGS